MDPTQQRVVADTRYLITGEAQPTALVQRVLDVRRGARRRRANPLAGPGWRSAVRSTPAGHRGPDRPDDDPAPGLAEICAQLVWTLTRDRPRPVRGVRVDGETVNLEGVPDGADREDWACFDPDAVPVDAVGDT